MISIAAVVATHNRPELLANRALKSIARQTRPPDILLVVDDSDEKYRLANEQIVTGFRAYGTKIIYLKNFRTPGASGAWNTALAWLQGTVPLTFAALLDDDDAWAPTYLEHCEAVAIDRDLDMVAAGIVYHNSFKHEGWPLSIPERLDVAQLLVRNPHVQGSNLFAKLHKLLEAGGFDEALRSTTDRDICIRLADLHSVKFGAVKQHLVHHYAEDDRERLSTRGGSAKLAGLRQFYLKYGCRMTDEQRVSFVERSQDAYACDPTVPDTVRRLPSTGDIHQNQLVAGHLELTIGVITSPDVGNLSRLLDSLYRSFGRRGDVTMRVLLLENGHQAAECRVELRDVVNRASRQGLDISVKSLEQQKADVDSGVFEVSGEVLSKRKSIALSRTMLQHYLFLEVKPRQGAVVWILDDDVVLEGLVYEPDGSIGVVEADYVEAILRLKETGASVVIGEVTGDPPVPSLSCMRTQLLDLYHNLHHLSALLPASCYPDNRDENRGIREARRDYYYDLSRSETAQLESPFWYEPGERDLRAGQVFQEMVSRLPEMLSGRQVFRSLVQTFQQDQAGVMAPSVIRGPSTLIFDLQALREFPNAVPSIAGFDTRRGDVIWCLLNRFACGREIVQAPLLVRQVRTPDADTKPDFDTLAQDIRGYAAYSAMYEVLQAKADERERRGEPAYGPELIEFNNVEIEQAVRLYCKYVKERLRAFELSFLRIRGLLSALRCFHERDQTDADAPWWLGSEEFERSAAELKLFLDVLESMYTEENLESFKQSFTSDESNTFEEYLKRLPDTVARYRSKTPLPAEQLREAAQLYVMAQFGTSPLRCLGIGEEGVSFTDGRMVYKYFHYWKWRDKESRITFLQSLVGRLSGCSTLPDLRTLHRNGDHVVAVYPFEEGSKYEGGRLDRMLNLLRECREAGIACRNIHPDNLLVTSDGLRFIDIGADIVQASDDEFEQMCRRAYLSYRFHFRSDLKSLMTRALTDCSMAELIGLEHFRRALDPRGLDELFYEPLSRLLLEQEPDSVLDYGSGDGRLAERLALGGAMVTAYDPDCTAIERCQSYGSSVEYGDGKLLDSLLDNSTRFDVVVCSRVLCTIHDPAEFEDVLRDLRRLVSDSGKAIIAVCNPFHISVESTELAVKQLPISYDYEDTFSYTKTVASTGNSRTEVHRSFSSYKLAFRKAGFEVEKVKELEGTDTRSLRPSSDHLVFTLSPIPEHVPSVSLLVKTCLMEWRIIERLVRHQVRQLERPVRFAEKVIVVDTSKGPFPRQYEQPDEMAHSDAMNSLIRDGIVDRVVYAPNDAEVMHRTYRKWFGAEAAETHSVNGQQLFASLFGFDSCKGDYVLQLDSDMLIARRNSSHNYLGEMVEVFERDPQGLFVPLSIYRSETLHYSAKGPHGDWRVEVRGCMYDRLRLQSVLPLQNELEEGEFLLPWHRAFDRLISTSDYTSYRGGDPTTASIHVPNEHKSDAEELFEIVDAIERGFVPDCQLGNVELTGSLFDWAGPKRSEPFVFVIFGRNVDPGKFRQCVRSMVTQGCGDWGAVVVEDASTNGFGDYAEAHLANFKDRVTLVRNRTRRGSLYNLWNAVTRYCTNPETVILTLDADDALAGPSVLDRVKVEYDSGADLTVGSMLRLDKEADYPVDFREPRSWHSNVWQHLRSFKKYLFDSVDVEDFKLDGEWIDPATDWAYMVPMVEMANNHRHIPDPLYLYEPARPKGEKERQARDSVISRILRKPAYEQFRNRR